jgi:glycosyltransferase involved in cell wall biosynthesis
MRLTILQYGGDYREAWERLSGGGKENYQAQRYSVNFVASLAQRMEQVAVICALTDGPYDEVLSNGVRAIGAGYKLGFHPRQLVPVLARTKPDRLALVTPLVPILKWAQRHQVPTVTTLADSFQKSNIRARIEYRRLAKLLNHSNVHWVGNHGISPALSLTQIGVRAEKIIPWDWPPSHRPADHAPRTRGASKPFTLIYVGKINELKGVGDLLRAVDLLNRDAFEVRLKIVGSDPDGAFQALADQLDCHEQVNFEGVLPNDGIPSAMRSADVVIIPSRHEYPEGLPLTIYEALASRTPIIASDHPMFRGALTHEKDAIVFRAGESTDLAAAIKRLAGDERLYSQLSKNSQRAWEQLQLPVVWDDLVARWLFDGSAGEEWLRAHRLDSGAYAERIAHRDTSTDLHSL